MTVLEELELKLKHEVRFNRDLRTFFRDVEDEFYIYYLVTGLLPDFNSFSPELESVLKKNYRKIGKDFKTISRDKFKLELNDDIKIKIDELVSRKTFERAAIASGVILATSQKRLRDIFNTAESKDRIDIAAETKKKLKQDNNSRATTIAQTETQNMAEFSKNTEAAEITAAGVVILKKRWNATLDNKTRPAHAIADGQTQRITDPYNVDGQLLMYPGDMSLGATVGNTINCRCSSETIL